MWLLIASAPPSDKPYWPGRRLLAVCDAAIWPLCWAIALNQAPLSIGIVGPVGAAVALLCAAGRLHRALCVNHRYHFTTWRGGRTIGALLVIGMMLKLMLMA